MLNAFRALALLVCLISSGATFAQSSCPDPDTYSNVCTSGDCLGGSGTCNYTTTFLTVFTGNNKYANITMRADDVEVHNECIGPLSNGTTQYSVSYIAACDAVITGTYTAYTNSSGPNPCGGTTCDIGTCANNQCQSGTLPIVLESFDVAYFEQRVQIAWATTSELQNDHFRIERSVNGIEWVLVGIVEGSNSSQDRNEYTLTDNGAQAGMVFYRLIQVDLDGSENHSAISFINVPGEKNTIFSSESRQIFQSSTGTAALVILYDVMGRESFRTNLEAGDRRQIPNHVRPGLYTMQVRAGQIIYSDKILLH